MGVTVEDVETILNTPIEDASTVEIPFEAPKSVKPRRGRRAADPTPTASGTKDATPRIPRKKPKKNSFVFKEEDIKTQIIGMHAMLGLYVSGVRISDEGAMMEARAIKDIIDLYGMEWLEKVGPWVALAIAVSIAEMPTMQALAMAARERREKRREQQEEHDQEKNNLT